MARVMPPPLPEAFMTVIRARSYVLAAAIASVIWGTVPLAQTHGATGAAKVERLASIVTALVAEHHRMSTMHDAMMEKMGHR